LSIAASRMAARGSSFKTVEMWRIKLSKGVYVGSQDHQTDVISRFFAFLTGTIHVEKRKRQQRVSILP